MYPGVFSASCGDNVISYFGDFLSPSLRKVLGCATPLSGGTTLISLYPYTLYTLIPLLSLHPYTLIPLYPYILYTLYALYPLYPYILIPTFDVEIYVVWVIYAYILHALYPKIIGIKQPSGSFAIDMQSDVQHNLEEKIASLHLASMDWRGV